MLEALWMVIAAIVVLDLWATRAVLRDTSATALQRAAQCGVVWFVPVVGAMLTLSLKRDQPEKGSGKYRDVPDAGDDYAYSGRVHRKNMETLEHTPGDGGHSPD